MWLRLIYEFARSGVGSNDLSIVQYPLRFVEFTSMAVFGSFTTSFEVRSTGMVGCEIKRQMHVAVQEMGTRCLYCVHA